jgi:hypothetical protein
MPRVGFEPTILVFERANALHALDRAATVISESIRLTARIGTGARQRILKRVCIEM